MRKSLLLFFLFFASFSISAQVPDYQFHRWFGSVVDFPEDIAVDNDGFMYLLDGFQIKKLDPAGAWIKTFPLKFYTGSTSMVSLVLDAAGNMYVLNSGDSKVQKYNSQGELLLQFGTFGVSPAFLGHPKGLAVDAGGNMYVADDENKRVAKFNDKGEFVFEFHVPTTFNDNIDNPVAIKVAKSGVIYFITRGNDVYKLSKEGQLIGSFHISIPNLPPAPGGENTLALDEKENIFVSDTHYRRIHKLSSSGKHIQSYGSDHVSEGYFAGTKIAVAVDPNGTVYGVSKSRGYSSIHIFDPAGNLKRKISNVELPQLLTQDNQGNYYVYTTFPGKVIKKYNAYGVQLLEIGAVQENGPVLGNPVAIATDAAGNLYCLETNSSSDWARIQKFSSEGKYLTQFDDFGNPGGLKWFTDLALDGQGNMYITDFREACVRKISPEGKFLGTLGDGSDGGGKLNRPKAVAVDVKGQIYVADNNSNRIQKFSPSGQVLAEFFSPVPTGEYDEVYSNGLGVDVAGRIYSWTNRNPFVLIYDPAGKEIARITGPTPELVALGEFSVNQRGTRLMAISRNFILEYLSGDAPRQSVITGKIYQDTDLNCLAGPDEKPLAGILVRADPGPYFGISDVAGHYVIPVDTGTYTVSSLLSEETGRIIVPSCPVDVDKPVRITSYGSQGIGPDLGHQVTASPILQVAVGSSRRRRCFRNMTTVSYANSGFAAAKDAKVTVQLPEHVLFVSANFPHVKDARGNFVFSIGDLQPGQRGAILLVDSVSCADPSIRNLTVCTKAWITPVPAYPAPATWNRADITVTANTVSEDQARFVIRNIGTGDMTDSLQFRVYQDMDLALVNKYKLAARDSLVLRITPHDRVVRVEVDQPHGHPVKAMAGANVEKKARVASALPSLAMMAYPPDDPEPEIAQDCQPIIDSFDPNDKQVVPAGITPEHFTPTNTPLRYTIRFQNTGTDYAYRVVVVDTLAADLDLSTLQVEAVSHSYRLTVSGKAKPVLTFAFDNIMLPDSARDQAGSNGFIQFSIKPRASLPAKTKIENYADIFFDYNEPVRTNTTVNRIFDMPLEVKADNQLLTRDIITSPEIHSFTPLQSRAGAAVTVSGRNFVAEAAGNKVAFNGVAAPVLGATDSTLTVRVPANAFSGKIQVLTPDGAAHSSRDYIIFQPPTLTAVVPAEAVPGAIITLTGSHFSVVAEQDTVTFQGFAARVLEASETVLKVEVPAGAALGKILIRTLGGEVESSQPFRVWYPPAITRFSPGKGKAGTAIELTGVHFAGEAAGNEVQFGTTRAQVLEAAPGRLLV